jgi:hypothetical protein
MDFYGLGDYEMGIGYISYVTCNESPDEIAVHYIDKTEMKILRKFGLPFMDTRDYPGNEILGGDICITFTHYKIKFIEWKTGFVFHQVNLEPGWIIEDCHLYGQVLVVRSSGQETPSFRLTIWQAQYPFGATCFKQLAFKRPFNSYCVCGDKQFVVVSQKIQGDDNKWLKQFISTKTLKIERSLSCAAASTFYKEGLFFMKKDDGLDRILEVASGTYLRDTQGLFKSLKYSSFLRVNSKYLVYMEYTGPEESAFNVYDLQAMRNPSVSADKILLTTLKVKMDVQELLVDETRLVCAFSNKFVVMDFGAYDRYKCLSPEALNLGI